MSAAIYPGPTALQNNITLVFKNIKVSMADRLGHTTDRIAITLVVLHLMEIVFIFKLKVK